MDKAALYYMLWYGFYIDEVWVFLMQVQVAVKLEYSFL